MKRLLPSLSADPACLHGLTERMYGDFQARVKAAGFELVPHATVVATPGYKAMQGASTLHVRVFVPIAYRWSSQSEAGGWTHFSAGAMAAVRLGERFARLAVGKDGDVVKIYLTEPVMTRGVTDAKLIKESANFLDKMKENL